MGFGAAVVRAYRLALDSMWLAPTPPNVHPLALDELLLQLQSFNNKEAPGDINTELIKDAPPTFLLKFLNMCWKSGFFTSCVERSH
jgi:hypothetical protein